MGSIEELINLIITLGIVAAPLYIMMSRRRRTQEQRRTQQSAGTQAPNSQSSERSAPGRSAPGRTARPPIRTGGAETVVAEPAGRDEFLLSEGMSRDDGGYAARRSKQSGSDSGSASPDNDRGDAGEKRDAAEPRAIGRLEKALRDILGVPDEAEQRAREQARQQEIARQKTIAAQKKKKRPGVAAPSIASREPFVARAPDVKIRALMPDTGSLSLSPGGMGSQQMRTAAGNLGASSSVEKSPPAEASLGPGWRRIESLPTFKRAILLSELFGKPHSLKDIEG